MTNGESHTGTPVICSVVGGGCVTNGCQNETEIKPEVHNNEEPMLTDSWPFCGSRHVAQPLGRGEELRNIFCI